MHLRSGFRSLICRMKHPAFSFLFFCGSSLVLGTFLAAFADSSAFSWMRLAIYSRLSIVCYLVAQFLPLLIAAYAVVISKLWLLHFICSCKLFSIAFMGSLIWIAFGSAGWLIRLLFLFSDILLVPVLFWFCFRRVMAYRNGSKRDFGICICVITVVSLINLLFISPFLERIISIS